MMIVSASPSSAIIDVIADMIAATIRIIVIGSQSSLKNFFMMLSFSFSTSLFSPYFWIRPFASSEDIPFGFEATSFSTVS